MKKPHHLIKGLCLGTLLVFICACGVKSGSTAVKSPDDANPGGQKPTPTVAPHFSEKQFQVGQWMQWKKTSNTGLIECEKWTLTRKDHWIGIEGRLSLDCENWFPDYLEKITFNPRSGRVMEHVIQAGQSLEHGNLQNKNIYERWYGSNAKVLYSHFRIELHSQTFLIFKVQGSSHEYFDHAEHPFHGIALRFEEKIDDLNWRYVFEKSNPPIPSLNTQSN